MEVPPNPRTPAELHQRRMLVAALFEDGQHSRAEIARILGVSRQAVHTWHTKWKAGGTPALSPGQQGADTLLTAEQERELLVLLEQGPNAHGWDDQRWTLARVNRLVGERYGVGFADPSGVWRMLCRLGQSWQVPVVRDDERSEEDIAA